MHGVVYFACLALLLAASTLADDGALARWMLTGKRTEEEVLQSPDFLAALLIAGFLYLPFMAAFGVRQVLMSNTLTADLGAWYAGPTWVIGAAVVGLAIAAFLNSRAGAPTFGRLLEE